MWACDSPSVAAFMLLASASEVVPLIDWSSGVKTNNCWALEGCGGGGASWYGGGAICPILLPIVDTEGIFFTYATCALPAAGGPWRCHVGVYGLLRCLGGRSPLSCPCIIGPHSPDIPLLVLEERWCSMGGTGGRAYADGGLIAATALVCAFEHGSCPVAYNCLPIAYRWPSTGGRDRCLTGITATGRLWPIC